MKKLNYSIIEKYKMKIPVIGITLDSENDNCYSKFPWYAIRKNYLHAIEKLGAIPFPLPHSLNSINDIASFIDGIIITGGNFDISPSIYGKQNISSRNEKNIRTIYEMKLCELGLNKNIPILGICGGEQLLNVCLGGTLIQDIKSLDYKTLNHEQSNPRNETSHEVFIVSQTKLHGIINQSRIMVNSAHHQAVKEPGNGLIINALSADGVIEGIEDPTKNFCIGVQWHPEFFIQDSDNKLLKAFIDAC